MFGQPEILVRPERARPEQLGFQIVVGEQFVDSPQPQPPQRRHEQVGMDVDDRRRKKLLVHHLQNLLGVQGRRASIGNDHFQASEMLKPSPLYTGLSNLQNRLKQFSRLGNTMDWTI